MSNDKQQHAILLLAYGGPDSLDDIPAYLVNIRDGRETPQRLIDEISHRYALIGGRSPLLEITRSAAAKLQTKIGMPVYVGMRHWQPTIHDTVAEIVADGVDHITAICMTPHYSTLSIGAYRTRLDEAIQATGADVALDFVEQWHTQADYLEGIAANTHETLRRFPDGERVKVVFTAHSLPAYIVERGDPYESQLRETARLLAGLLELAADRWTFCYQSAAQTGRPWLGPQIEELVPELAAQGERNLLVAPVGFIADHVEILYDIDIGVRDIGQRHDVRVERTPMLNDGESLVRALAALVRGDTAGESVTQ